MSCDLTKSRDQRMIWVYRCNPSREVTILPSLIGIGTLIRTYSGFILPHNLARPCYQRAMRLYWLKPIRKSYHPGRFGGNKHCGSGYKMILVCNMILQDHLIRGLCEYTGRSPSRLVIILPRLVVIGTVVVDIWWF